jgi:hypothetical protein
MPFHRAYCALSSSTSRNLQGDGWGSGLRALMHFLAFETSDSGHERTSRLVRVMSVIPLNADISQRGLHVRLVP